MRIKLVVILTLALILLGLVACSPSVVYPYTPTETPEGTVTQPSITYQSVIPSKTTSISSSPAPSKSSLVREVKLDDSILQACIKDSENRTEWGINPSVLRLNYKTGVKVSGWIVLHNGDEVDKLVTVKSLPTTKEIPDSEHNMVYQSTPNTIKPEYIIIGDTEVRLTRMETKAVSVSLLVPEGIEIESTNWAFYVNADGQPIGKKTQQILVTTEANEISGDLLLTNGLLANRMGSLQSIKSDISEILTAKKFDAVSRNLTVEGFLPNKTRTVTLTYEYGEMFTSARNQIWFLTML